MSNRKQSCATEIGQIAVEQRPAAEMPSRAVPDHPKILIASSVNQDEMTTDASEEITLISRLEKMGLKRPC